MRFNAAVAVKAAKAAQIHAEAQLHAVIPRPAARPVPLGIAKPAPSPGCDAAWAHMPVAANPPDPGAALPVAGIATFSHNPRAAYQRARALCGVPDALHGAHVRWPTPGPQHLIPTARGHVLLPSLR